ncbi:MAG: site-specific integrase, partial [Erythrobacter sp.]
MSAADILAAWRAHLADSRRRSPHTVRAYCAAASRLCHASELSSFEDVAKLETHDLRAHLASRRADGLSNASAARELSALKAFIAFARAETGDPDPAAPRIRGPRLKKGLPRPVTPDEAVGLAETIEAVASEDWVGARDRAVLLLMYGSGLRIAEALSLEGRDAPLGDTLQVTGKGAKQRIVPILPITREAVVAYAAACPYPLSAKEPLFRGAKGGPLSQNMVQKAMARARRALG